MSCALPPLSFDGVSCLSIAFDSNEIAATAEDEADAAGAGPVQEIDITQLRKKLVGLCSNLDTLRLCPQVFSSQNVSLLFTL